MQNQSHPYRSVLYMPGSNPRALDKAKTLAADALILDLEDAVAPGEKTRARELVVEAVRAGGYGRRKLIVRINALSTEWGRLTSPPSRNAGPMPFWSRRRMDPPTSPRLPKGWGVRPKRHGSGR